MLRWAAFFFALVLICAGLAFTTVLGAAVAIAKIAFYLFLVLFLVTLVGGLVVARKVTRK